MAKLTNVYRMDDIAYVEIGKRQLPLVAGENLMMLMDLNNKGLVIDCPPVKGKELEEFTRKYNILSYDELRKSLEVDNLELLSVLGQCVQCVGCRKSVERLFFQLTRSGHQTLDPITVMSSGVLSITNERIQSPQSLCTLLCKHNDILSNLLGSQIKTKKSSRCCLHSLDKFRAKPFSEIWRNIWMSMKQKCKEELAVIETKELSGILEDYLKKHKFCQECRMKVKKAYTFLISEKNRIKEKGFVPSLYSNIKKCPGEKHIHVHIKVDFIDTLIKKAEPELNGSYSKHRERHAKTLEIAQEEVLTCVGMILYERLRRIYFSLQEEERACQVLAAVGVHALYRSFDMFVEKKQGISNLELLYKEISRAEKAKQHKKEQKKIKKKKRKNEKKNSFESCEMQANQIKDNDLKNELEFLNYPCESGGDLCAKSVDGGYSSELSSPVNSRTSSVASSPEGSVVSCSDGFCNHNSENFTAKLSDKNFVLSFDEIHSSSQQCTEKSLSLQQMLEKFDDIETDETFYIPDEVVLEYKCRENIVKQLRQQLRENLRQNFAQMCVKTRMAQNIVKYMSN